jgi:hypothetical protein
MVQTRFKGDPVPQETGSGKGPDIPLEKRVQPTTVEMLNQQGEDNDDDESDELDDTTNYTRERIGARIGQPLEEASKIEEVEQALDADDVVPLLFQKPVNLQDQGIMHHWSPGVHLVPVSLAGDKAEKLPMHWWLKHNKCKYAGKRIPKPEPADA